MSGIAGIIHFDGKPIEPGQIEAMTAAMHYRGPDGINHWRQGNVALGQCMLCTTPESLEETQPLTNEDESLVLVMDGRVDNYEELRRELLGKGAALRTRADAELVLRAYEVWDRDCLHHIDGDFALVIWDARRQEAFCARDRVGNKPFHYHWNGSTLAFASELHPILDLSWVEEQTNEGMLAEFLAWEVDSKEETLWKDVMRLAPAHKMSVTNRGPHPKLYWRPDLQTALPFTRDEEYFEHYLDLLLDSVRRQSRSHRAIACEVSGGLDSSALFCVSDHLRRAGQLAAPGLQGYTLAFTDQSDANELAYARAVGTHLGAHVQEIPPLFPPTTGCQKVAGGDRDFAGYPNGLMFEELWKQAAGDGSRVLFNGVGGDEWLSGERTYYAEELTQFRLASLYRCLIEDAAHYGVRQTTAWFLREGLFPLLSDSWQAHVKSVFRFLTGRETTVPFWLSSRMLSVLSDRKHHNRFVGGDRTRRIGQKQLLAILDSGFRVIGGEMTERRIARAGLEIRRPFHSTQLIDFAFATPERLRLRIGVDKYLHLEALKKFLPPQIYERRTKADFSSVFRSELDQMKNLMVEEIPKRRREWLESDGMLRLFSAYENEPQRGKVLWVLWTIYACHTLVD